MYNLDEDQKKTLRWIVQKIREGELGEIFDCVFLINGKFARFQGKGENITDDVPINESVLQALKASGLIFIERHEKTVLHCGLLGDKAYNAVDTNFGEGTDVRVTPLTEREILWKIIISIILLGFSLAGFIFLPWASAVLWLFFLIIAYPVALAFTTAKQSMDNRNLVEIYKAGLKQIPVIRRFFGN
mgnify:CR=1 FL=1|jgi:hypothetical protein